MQLFAYDFFHLFYLQFPEAPNWVLLDPLGKNKRM